MLERIILNNLINSEEYVRKVLPYLEPEYFHNSAEQKIFLVINEFIQKYNKSPDITAVSVDLFNRADLNEHVIKDCQDIIANFQPDTSHLDSQWLVDQTEKFCQDKAIENGLRKSIEILEDKEKGKLDRGSIPKILQDALAVSFDSHIGHDFLGDWEARYAFYHNVEEKIPFDLDILNEITNGGFSNKTLNVLMGGVGFGKSLVMCHMAAANMMKGKNVLYITMEMAEERIAERVDANLLNVDINQLVGVDKPRYEALLEKRVRAKTLGKLIIKEYPTALAGADNFRHLLNELRIKRNFTADIIYIDYLNICKSSRVKFSANLGLYLYVKFIAEELRGLAVEYDIPIVSATQLNREGFQNSDPGMEHSSESFGLPATTDILLGIVSNEELAKLNQLSFKQIKNRYADPNKNTRFIIGCDRSKMRLYNVENKAQYPAPKSDDDVPVFDKGDFTTKSDFSSWT